MKKMNFSKAVRKALLMCSFVAGFLVFGFQTSHAQFVDHNDAVTILETEMVAAHGVFANATAGTPEYVEFGRKYTYYKRLLESISENDPIDQAIQEDVVALPTFASNSTPNFGPNLDVTSPLAATSKQLMLTAEALLAQ